MAPLLLLALLLLSGAAAAIREDKPQQLLEFRGIDSPRHGHASDEPPTPQANLTLTGLLSQSGCARFAALVAATPNASEVLESRFAGGRGLTVFCPDDEAVSAFTPAFHNNLSAGRQAALLLHHAVGARISGAALRTMANGALLQTLAAGAIVFLNPPPPGAAVVRKTALDEARLGLAVHLIDAVMPVPIAAAAANKCVCGGGFAANWLGRYVRCFPAWAVPLWALSGALGCLLGVYLAKHILCGIAQH